MLAGSALLPLGPAYADGKRVVQSIIPINKGNWAELTITREQELRFGKFVVTGDQGRVLVPLDGFSSYTGTIGVGGNDTGPARLTFRGEPNRYIDINIMAPVLSGFGPNGAAKLEKVVMEPVQNIGGKQLPGGYRLKLDSSGQNAILIGGSLLVTPNGSTGPTTIIFPVTASYVNEKQY